MQLSYSKNYIKIYFYQILSIILGFLSLFIVVPRISSDQTTFGIYTVCISITIFLSYADLGFLGAARKYAAESYSRGNLKKEIELIGFSHFVLFIFVLILSFIFLFLSFYPEVIIKGLEEGGQKDVAEKLLLILAIFSPTIIIQRCLQMIFGIRLQEYVLQKITIIGNLMKILSVFYFFSENNYDIVGYFLFLQIVNVIVALIGVLRAKKKYNYDFTFLLRSFKFSYEIFNNIKGLAFSSLTVTIAWVIYYELDSFVIANVLDAEQVAIYAIGFTILTFFRTLLGVFFSPFSARFNHFIGENKEIELNNFYIHILKITFPVVTLPILAIVVFARPLVISWVGIEYEKSIGIVQWLVLCNILAFISYPAGALMIALERLKEIYIINFIIPIIYWGGIFFTINKFGVESFAIFKFIAFIISGIIYLFISLKYIKVSIFKFFKDNIFPFIIPILLMITFLFLLKDGYVDKKDKMNLLINIVLMGLGVFIGMVMSIVLVKDVKKYFIKIIKYF